MAEVLKNLPPELKNKVFTYTSHPMADAFKKEMLPGMTKCTMCLEALQEHFPNLTRYDMHVLVGKKSQPSMSLLYCALFQDEHKSVSLLVLSMWKEAMEPFGEQPDPHWFLEFLREFFKEHRKMWKKMSVDEFYQWVVENCTFHYTD